ncbi:hypothetical protein NMG60_11030307 [Bertholletia excelsa]
MEKLTKQALLYMENLTLPSFQVVVIRGNLACAHCRGRISQIVSKMKGLRECTVDVCNKQVIMKGDVKFSCGARNDASRKKMKNERFPWGFLKANLMNRCLPG